MEESGIPDSCAVFPNEYGTSVFLKNIVKAENIIVGDYTYYDDTKSPLDWEHNNVLSNYPFFGEKLVIGRVLRIGRGFSLHDGSYQPQAFERDDLSVQCIRR